MTRLAGRVVIVTGAAQGLGFAYARHLAEEGAMVIIADVVDGRSRVADLAKPVREKIAFHRADVTAYEDVEQLMAATKDRFGRIDVLINNASIFSSLVPKPFNELVTAEWDKILSVNVTGTFHCVKAVFPTMKAQQYGKIINVASDAIFKGLPNLLHYVASKGAILAMTRSLARELGQYNITVNAIAPGLTIHDEMPSAYRKRNEQVVQLRCLPRTQTADDLLGAIFFFASDESDFVTGQTLVVDGGEVFH